MTDELKDKLNCVFDLYGPEDLRRMFISRNYDELFTLIAEVAIKFDPELPAIGTEPFHSVWFGYELTKDSPYLMADWR